MACLCVTCVCATAPVVEACAWKTSAGLGLPDGGPSEDIVLAVFNCNSHTEPGYQLVLVCKHQHLDHHLFAGVFSE